MLKTKNYLIGLLWMLTACTHAQERLASDADCSVYEYSEARMFELVLESKKLLLDLKSGMNNPSVDAELLLDEDLYYNLGSELYCMNDLGRREVGRQEFDARFTSRDNNCVIGNIGGDLAFFQRLVNRYEDAVSTKGTPEFQAKKLKSSEYHLRSMIDEILSGYHKDKIGGIEACLKEFTRE